MKFISVLLLITLLIIGCDESVDKHSYATIVNKEMEVTYVDAVPYYYKYTYLRFDNDTNLYYIDDEDYYESHHIGERVYVSGEVYKIK